MTLPFPDAPWQNTALHSHDELVYAQQQVEHLGLPGHDDQAKNWDHLGALDFILKHTDTSARILDAGADHHSVLLPWLAAYGYQHLVGINPVFPAPFTRGTIEYQPGDITQTSFADAAFDIVACMSVIEHGVNSEAYFRETSRIIKSGGYLITSTDYYPESVETHGKVAFGVPIHIFAKTDIIAMVAYAERHGFRQTGDIDYTCTEKPISWKGCHYSFILFMLQKQ